MEYEEPGSQYGETLAVLYKGKMDTLRVRRGEDEKSAIRRRASELLNHLMLTGLGIAVLPFFILEYGMGIGTLGTLRTLVIAVLSTIVAFVFARPYMRERHGLRVIWLEKIGITRRAP